MNKSVHNIIVNTMIQQVTSPSFVQRGTSRIQIRPESKGRAWSSAEYIPQAFSNKGMVVQFLWVFPQKLCGAIDILLPKYGHHIGYSRLCVITTITSRLESNRQKSQIRANRLQSNRQSPQIRTSRLDRGQQIRRSQIIV